MALRPSKGARSRWWNLVGMAGAMVATFAFATIAAASMSSITPGSGTVSPGESTSATFTLTPPLLLTSCVLATVSPQPLHFSVSFDGLGLGELPANCAVLDDQEVEMTVTALSGAPPGDYEVTITEVALLGDDLISTRTWPFTVPPPPTTTTTSSTTPTSSTTTTTTQSTTTTTTTATPTPTSSPETSTTTTTPAVTPEPDVPTTTRPSNGSGNVPDGPTTTSTEGTTTTVDEETSTTEPDSDDAVVFPPGSPGAEAPETPGPSSGDGGEAVAADEAPGAQTGISLFERLRNELAKAVPLSVAEAVLSPFVIAEFLFRNLLSSALGYLLPLLIAGVLGAWMVLRMRREVTDDELAQSGQPRI